MTYLPCIPLLRRGLQPQAICQDCAGEHNKTAGCLCNDGPIKRRVDPYVTYRGEPCCLLLLLLLLHLLLLLLHLLLLLLHLLRHHLIHLCRPHIHLVLRRVTARVLRRRRGGVLRSIHRGTAVAVLWVLGEHSLRLLLMLLCGASNVCCSQKGAFEMIERDRSLTDLLLLLLLHRSRLSLHLRTATIRTIS